MKKQLLIALFVSLVASTYIELTKHKSTGNVVTTTGSMNITNYQIYQYSGNFTIGTPAQNTTVALELNSNQFWIPLNNETCYQSSASSTANITSTGGSIQYGKFYVAGYMGTEVLGQAYLGVSNVSMATLFTYKEVGMGVLNACGLMGLSNDQSWKNFLEVAVTNGQLTDSQFAIQLKNTTNQNVYFYASSPKFPSTVSLVWFKTTTSNRWVISVNGTVVGQTTYSQPSGLTSAIIDTSLSMTLIASNAYAALTNDSTIKAQCQQQNGYILCPCLASGFPVVFFQSNGHHLGIQPADYMAPLSGSFCMLGFAGIDASEVPFLGFGDLFLKDYFTAFDKANSQVGFSGVGVHAYDE